MQNILCTKCIDLSEKCGKAQKILSFEFRTCDDRFAGEKVSCSVFRVSCFLFLIMSFQT